MLISGLGLSYAVLRYVLLVDDKESKLGYVNYAIRFGSLINIYIVVVIIGFASIVVFPEAYKEANLLLIIMVIAIPFNYMISVMLSTDRAMMSVKRYAFVSLLNSTIVIVTRIVASYFGKIIFIAITFVVCEIIIAIIYFAVEKKYYFSKVKENRLESKEKKNMMIYSIQYMITNGIWAMFILNETTMLGIFSKDISAIADYKVAYTIPASLSIFSTAIGVFVGPYFTIWEKNCNYLAFKRGFKNTIALGIGMLFAIVIVALIFGKSIIPFLFGRKYNNIILLTNVLLFAAFANSIRSLVANIFAAIGKIEINLIISISGIIMQIVLGYLIIPSYGGLGLAYMDVIIYSAMAIFEICIMLCTIRKMRR